MSKVVMPGQSSLFCADCVDLSALTDIHVLAALKQERRGWPGIGERKRRRPSDGYGPAMTKNESISDGQKQPESVGAFWVKDDRRRRLMLPRKGEVNRMRGQTNSKAIPF